MSDRCAVCGGGRIRPKLRKDTTEILECAECGLAFWKPEAGFRSETIYGADYFDDPAASRGYDDYAGLEDSLRASFARRLARLAPAMPDARLLDVGAAYGYAIAEARQRGFRACGIEISRAAAAQAGRRVPDRVVVAGAGRLPFAPASFAVVTLWDVLEHLPDPHAAIGEAARVLEEGGRLVLSTGDVGSLVARVSRSRWHLYTLPEHLFFHTRDSLQRLLEAHGFEVESMRAEAGIYTLGYLIERLRKTLLGRTVSRPARWPGAGLRVPLNLFDVVTVSAVRRSEPLR